MLQIAEQKGVDTIWDRYEAQTPICGFGKMGICCRICDIGPCRISKKAPKGACGADAATIASRHLARQVAAGASAHSDHGRDVCHALLLTAEGKAEGYEIKDGKKLRRIAAGMGFGRPCRGQFESTSQVVRRDAQMVVLRRYWGIVIYSPRVAQAGRVPVVIELHEEREMTVEVQ